MAKEAAKRPQKPKRKPGRPSIYSDELAEKICTLLAEGNTLTSICKMDGMPGLTTVMQWAMDDEHPFAALYARARERQIDTMAESIVDIADEEDDPNSRRVRVDARKWLASKMAPKRYGDRVQNEHTGPDGKPLQLAAPPVLILAPAAPGDAPITLAPLEQPAQRIEGDAKP